MPEGITIRLIGITVHLLTVSKGGNVQVATVVRSSLSVILDDRVEKKARVMIGLWERKETDLFFFPRSRSSPASPLTGSLERILVILPTF